MLKGLDALVMATVRQEMKQYDEVLLLLDRLDAQYPSEARLLETGAALRRVCVSVVARCRASTSGN